MRGSSGFRAARFSRMALTLPGSVAMSVWWRVPTTGRESTASGVCFRPSFTKACAMAGASLWSSGRIDSGVMSLGLNPVPPVRSQERRGHRERESEGT
jgi:hypothetical protein